MPWPQRDKEPQHKILDTKKMEEYGVHVTSGIQLQARTNIINELTETFHKPLIGQTPAKRMEEIGDKIAKIDTLIQTACLPYLGAGGRNSSRAIEGYFTERRMIMEDYIIKMNELADTKDQAVQGQIEVRFQIFPFHYFFEDAFYLAQHTFTPEQITPTQDRTTVIHTVAQPKPFDMGALDTIGKDRTNESKE